MHDVLRTIEVDSAAFRANQMRESAGQGGSVPDRAGVPNGARDVGDRTAAFTARVGHAMQ